jgi:S-adenosylmethionine:tRNA ribosyltransferase-isomerase
MHLSDFDFPLPADRIAQRPARPRDAARLLVVRADGGREDRIVRELPALLRPGDLLVVNDTKVLPTRLVGRRGAVAVEATLIEPHGTGRWWALAKPGKRLRPGDRIEFAEGFAAAVAGKSDDGRVLLEFGADDEGLAAALERHGAAPLPPYIRRDSPDPRDREDYQTVYAERPGAVAAPTAGLHFTSGLLDALATAGIGRAAVTLHVGAGTFLPVKVERIEDHRMHAERGEVGDEAAAAIEGARAAGGRIIAVGTTALRLLETAAAAHGRVRPWAGATALFITPGFRFRAADLLLTNFHLPRSTLFMLFCAFAGTGRMRAAYAHALARGYRFYSYGDACLLEREAEP